MRTMQKASDMRKPTISSVRGAIKLHGNDLSSGKLLVPFLIAVLHSLAQNLNSKSVDKFRQAFD